MINVVIVNVWISETKVYISKGFGHKDINCYGQGTILKSVWCIQQNIIFIYFLNISSKLMKHQGKKKKEWPWYKNVTETKEDERKKICKNKASNDIKFLLKQWCLTSLSWLLILFWWTKQVNESQLCLLVLLKCFNESIQSAETFHW